MSDKLKIRATFTASRSMPRLKFDYTKGKPAPDEYLRETITVEAEDFRSSQITLEEDIEALEKRLEEVVLKRFKTKKEELLANRKEEFQEVLKDRATEVEAFKK